ncbi:unnamed protein product [Camellia sinensis]
MSKKREGIELKESQVLKKEKGNSSRNLSIKNSRKSRSKLTWIAACEAFLCGLLGYR